MPSKKDGKAVLDSDWRRTSEEMMEKFLERAKKLWRTHFPAAKQILDEAENPVINLTFKANLNFAESEAKLETSIRYSEVHSDSMDDTFENPRPLAEPPGEPLPGVDEEAKAESKKVKAKKRAAKPKEETEPEAPHIMQGEAA